MVVRALFCTYSARQKAVAERLLQGFPDIATARFSGVSRSRANQVKQALWRWAERSRFGLRLHRSSSSLLFRREKISDPTDYRERMTGTTDLGRLVVDLSPIGIDLGGDDFAVRWDEDSIRSCDINHGDTLIVQRRCPIAGEIVIALVGGEVFAGRLGNDEEVSRRIAATDHESRIRVGVVAAIIRPFAAASTAEKVEG